MVTVLATGLIAFGSGTIGYIWPRDPEVVEVVKTKVVEVEVQQEVTRIVTEFVEITSTSEPVIPYQEAPYPPPDTSRRAGGGYNQAPAWMRGGFQSRAEYDALDPATKALLEP